MNQKISVPLVVYENGQKIVVGQAVVTYICNDYIDVTAKIVDRRVISMISKNNLNAVSLGDFTIKETPDGQE